MNTLLENWQTRQSGISYFVPVLPPGESVWVFAGFASRMPDYCVQIWRHLKYWKYLTCCIGATITGSLHRECAEVWTCGFWDMQLDRHTDTIFCTPFGGKVRSYKNLTSQKGNLRYLWVTVTAFATNLSVLLLRFIVNTLYLEDYENMVCCCILIVIVLRFERTFDWPCDDIVPSTASCLYRELCLWWSRL